MPWEDDALNEGLVTHAPFYETVRGGWVEEYKICTLQWYADNHNR